MAGYAGKKLEGSESHIAGDPYGRDAVDDCLFPLLLVPALRATGCSGVTLTVPAILFATPAALTAGAFAGRYGADEALAGRTVVLSNLLSLVTLPVLAAVLASL